MIAPQLSPAEACTIAAPGERRTRCFELSLVTLVALGQYILISIFMLNGAQYSRPPDSTYRLSSIFQQTTSLLLLGYVLSRRKLRFRDIGLRWSIGDIGRGAGVWVLSWLAYYAGYYLIQAIAYTASPTSTSKPAYHWDRPGYYAIPFLLLNPFFEELIVRAYLMTEVRELTGSPLLAIFVSVAVQTSYHLYYGWRGALSLAFTFMVFSIYYANTRRITPVILAHEVLDLAVFFH